LQRQPEIPASLGAGWVEVLTGMTTRDPADRLSSADAAVLLRELTPGGASDTATIAASYPATARYPESTTDQRTRVMPMSEAESPLPSTRSNRTAQTAQTERFDGTPQPGPTPTLAAQPARRTGSRRPVIIGALVAVAAVIALVFFVPMALPADPGPDYPAVDGDLGTHLQQLQESVKP
jgi:cell division septation protein DedD